MKVRHLFDNVSAGALSIIVHVAFLSFLVISIDWSKEPDQIGTEYSALEAVVLDEGFIRKELARLEQEDQQKQETEKQRIEQFENQLNDAKQKREKEEQKLKQLQKDLKKNKEKQQKKTFPTRFRILTSRRGVTV